MRQFNANATLIIQDGIGDYSICVNTADLSGKNVVNGVCAKMKKKYMLVILALMMIVLVTAFIAIQSRSGDLPVRALLLIAATCLPPLVILFYTSSKIKRSSNKF